MQRRFRDRTEAGRLLAEKLEGYSSRSDVIVLALPRGGVPVGFEIAKALNAPLDVLIVRKLGMPDQPELAMGAIASEGIRVLNEELLKYYPIPGDVIEKVTEREREELRRRERAYRGDRPVCDVQGGTVILVDDGIATGTTMHSAIESLKRRQAAQIVIAVPVAAASICEELRRIKNHVVVTCLTTPEPFIAVGLWYDWFPQLADEDVRDLLDRAAQQQTAAATPGIGRQRSQGARR
jgi:putative phosphoribosyl transferase